MANRLHQIRSFATGADVWILLSGSAWSLTIQCFSKAALVISIFVGARMLGPTDFGVFVGFQAIVLLGIGLWDLGFTTMASRREAAGELSYGEMVATCLRGRVVLAPVFFLTVGLGATFLDSRFGGDISVGLGLLVLSGLFTGLSNIPLASMNARLRFRDSAAANIVGRIFLAGGSLVVLAIKPNNAFSALALAYLLGEFVTGVVAYRQNRESGSRVRMPALSSRSRRFLNDLFNALPLAAAGILILVYNRLDVVIVAALSTAKEAGLYAPASRLQDALMVLPAVAVAGLLPVASRRFGLDKDHYAVTQSLILTIFVALLVTIPGTVLAIVLTPIVVEGVLGSDYSGSVEPTRILILSLPFIAVGSPTMAALIAIDRAVSTTLMIAVGFTVALLGMLLLVPRYGAVGGAWASFLREPAIAICAVILYRRSVTCNKIAG